MTQYLMDICKNEYKNATGKFIPCSNQSVGCYILCDKMDYKVKEFLAQKHVKILRKSSNEQLVEFDDTVWKVRSISPDIRGCRYYKVYIDNRISDEIMKTVIMPCMCMYCKEVNFF